MKPTHWVRTAVAATALTAVTGCSYEQITKWTEWYQQDPQAAVAYANLPEVQLHLIADWDRDGIIEPEHVDEPDEPRRNDSGNRASPDPEDSGESIREAPSVSSGSVWDRLADCESGGDWSIATGNGYFGGLQFLPSTWRAYGGSGMPHEASREEQIRVAENVRDDVGFSAWPACSRRLGLR